MAKENSFVSRIVKYVKESPGSVFVLIFMILLIISAAFLIFEREDISERLANWGFTILLIGIILKIIELKRSRDE